MNEPMKRKVAYSHALQRWYTIMDDILVYKEGAITSEPDFDNDEGWQVVFDSTKDIDWDEIVDGERYGSFMIRIATSLGYGIAWSELALADK